jgi:hypothetical protein
MEPIFPSPSERFEHYRLALESLKKNEGYDNYGLCIVLGDVVHGDYVKNAPWGGFDELKVYYPELIEPRTDCDHHQCVGLLTGFEDTTEALLAIQERIGILEKIISNMEKGLNYYTTIKK